MLAAVYETTGPARDVLRVREVPVPTAGQGEVLVRIHASGINSSDLKRRSGWRATAPLNRPVIPHTDGAGVVEALGAGVDREWLGRRVWIWNANAEARPSDPCETGTAAEFAAVPLAHVVPLADRVGFDVGACLGIPACTAHYALFADGPVAGRTVLVRGGAGAVGHVAIQFASQAGAMVLATVSSDDKAEAARRAGAQVVINYCTQDATAAFRELVPAGFDRIIEVDFGANAAEDAALLRQDGILVSYSSTSRPEPVLPYYALQQKGALIRLVTSYRIPAPARRDALDAIITQLAAGRLEIAVAARFPLPEISAAHQHVELGRGFGRTVLVI